VVIATLFDSEAANFLSAYFTTLTLVGIAPVTWLVFIVVIFASI
jgi:hypothetical protein